LRDERTFHGWPGLSAFDFGVVVRFDPIRRHGTGHILVENGSSPNVAHLHRVRNIEQH